MAAAPTPQPEPAESSWGFEEGAELVPGRSIVRPLGGGHRFEVFLVWDEGLYALGVAKVLRPHVLERERVREDLRDEAELLERLAHPVIVRGFDAVLDGPRPHLLLEHLEGPTLRRLIRRGGAIPLEQLLPLAAHVGAALRYMALNGVVHLDVKPDNIVMGVPPRVIDLSIARSIQRAGRVKSPVGTDAYMPPEQCDPGAHPGEVGPAADVWGLGATLHHALSGKAPFPRPKGAGDSDDPLVRFPQLAEEPVPLPSRVPDPLRELVASCLAKRPADRISAGDLVDRLEPLVAELPRKLLFGRRGARVP
ncbi:MAG: serine/threonine-protein kinase [Thermoleophilaceae bacterium]